MTNGTSEPCQEGEPWEQPRGTGDLLCDEATPYGEGKYDLAERTAKFGEAVIRLARKIPQGPTTRRLIDQLVGAATSVGANYCEADDAVSKREFRVKIGTCRKEARETKFFLRMLASAIDAPHDELRLLWREADELHRIFSRIYRTTNDALKP